MSQQLKKSGTIGFVPTMGALHQGHLELVTKAKQFCDMVAVSIFVNPTQFGPHEDYHKYPRKLEDDLNILEKHTSGNGKASGVDMVFAPHSPQIMYPQGCNTFVVIPDIEDVSVEGKARPGHFRGVLTIVNKLFNIVQPDAAFFGQKDAHQCIVVKKMVRDLFMPVNIVIVDTMRESHGLAMSSRNAYLNPDERNRAGIIYQALQAAKQAHATTANMTKARLVQIVEQKLQTEPSISKIEYISIANGDNAAELRDSDVVLPGSVLSLALKLNQVRLIDNVVF